MLLYDDKHIGYVKSISSIFGPIEVVPIFKEKKSIAFFMSKMLYFGNKKLSVFKENLIAGPARLYPEAVSFITKNKLIQTPPWPSLV